MTQEKVEIEKGALCKWIETGEHGCGLKPNQPTEIECIICLSTAASQTSQAAIALAGPFQTNLFNAQNFIKMGMEAARLQDSLAKMLQTNHQEEWKNLSEKTAKLAAGGGVS